MMFENSRYLRTPVYTRLGEDSPILKIRSRYTFNIQNATIYEWVEGDTLDGLAYKYYGIAALRWAILDANPSYRSEFEIEYGDRIFIPDYDEVVDLVNV